MQSMMQSVLDKIIQDMSVSYTSDSEESEKKEVSSKEGKVRKPRTPKEDKAKKPKKLDSFPTREPVSPEEFLLSLTSVLSSQEKLDMCYGFVSFLKEARDARVSVFVPSMSLGTLWDSCRLISLHALFPEQFIKQGHKRDIPEQCRESHESVDKRFVKIMRSMNTLLMLSEHTVLENKENAIVKRELASELEQEGDSDSAESLIKEAVAHDVKAAIEQERATNIRRMIEEKDVVRMCKIYDSLGGEIHEEVLGVDVGSFGAFKK